MTVHVLLDGFASDGYEVRGVYSTFDRAKEVAQKFHERRRNWAGLPREILIWTEVEDGWEARQGEYVIARKEVE